MVCSKLLSKLGKTEEGKGNWKLFGWLIDLGICFFALIIGGFYVLMSVLTKNIGISKIAGFAGKGLMFAAITGLILLTSYLIFLKFTNKEKYQAMLKILKIDGILYKISGLIPSIREQRLMEEIDRETEKKSTSTSSSEETEEQKITKSYEKLWNKLYEVLGPEAYKIFCEKVSSGEIARSNAVKEDINLIISAAEEFKRQYSLKAENNPAQGSNEPEADKKYTPQRKPNNQNKERPINVEFPKGKATDNVVEETLSEISDNDILMDLSTEDIPADLYLTEQKLREMTIPMDVLTEAKESFAFEHTQLHPELEKLINGRKKIAVQMYRAGLGREEVRQKMSEIKRPQIGGTQRRVLIEETVQAN